MSWKEVSAYTSAGLFTTRRRHTAPSASRSGFTSASPSARSASGSSSAVPTLSPVSVRSIISMAVVLRGTSKTNCGFDPKVLLGWRPPLFMEVHLPWICTSCAGGGRSTSTGALLNVRRTNGPSCSGMAVKGTTMYEASGSRVTLRVISRLAVSSVSRTSSSSRRHHLRPRKSRGTLSTVSPMRRCRSFLGRRCPKATRESRCMRDTTISQRRVTVRWYCGLLHQLPLTRPFWNGAPPAVLPTHAPLMVS
mmetsp:Transcript_37700/g.72261  ORF Transcript_37700/g.72261 Transcript_37700/m.72261 type:complete len:250 (-) Transcript_37700:1179-1928(-)